MILRRFYLTENTNGTFSFLPSLFISPLFNIIENVAYLRVQPPNRRANLPAPSKPLFCLPHPVWHRDSLLIFGEQLNPLVLCPSQTSLSYMPAVVAQR